MMPALTDQERIFINKFTYRFGIRQHRARRHWWFSGSRWTVTKSYIKRVIGLPGGHVVTIDGGTVLVNGSELDETLRSEEYRDRSISRCRRP